MKIIMENNNKYWWGNSKSFSKEFLDMAEQAVTQKFPQMFPAFKQFIFKDVTDDYRYAHFEITGILPETVSIEEADPDFNNTFDSVTISEDVVILTYYLKNMEPTETNVAEALSKMFRNRLKTAYTGNTHMKNYRKFIKSLV